MMLLVYSKRTLARNWGKTNGVGSSTLNHRLCPATRATQAKNKPKSTLDISIIAYYPRYTTQRSYHTTKFVCEANTSEKINTIVKEQSKILARKAKLPRGSSEAAARIDREANDHVSKNIRLFINNGEYELVTELLRLSSSLSIVPFTTALRGFMAAHRSDELDALFRLMRSKHILPPATVFNQVVSYFALGACASPAAAVSSSAQLFSSVLSTSARNNAHKNPSTEAKRAKMFFNDLKSVYVPSAATYEALWLAIPTPASARHMTTEHEALWKEMKEAGVVPTETLLLRILRSIHAQKRANPNHAASNKTLATLLDDFEAVCRRSFGFNYLVSSSTSTKSGDIETGSMANPSRMMSTHLIRSWLSAVVKVKGKRAAFRLVSTMKQVSATGIPQRSATTILESAATVRAHAGANGNLTESHEISFQNSDVFVIPTTSCPHEILIGLLRHDPKLAIVAWNQMSTLAKTRASPATLKTILSASLPSSHDQLFDLLPTITKADPALLLQFSKSEAIPQQKLWAFASALPKHLGEPLLTQGFFDDAAVEAKIGSEKLLELKNKYQSM